MLSFLSFFLSASPACFLSFFLFFEHRAVQLGIGLMSGHSVYVLCRAEGGVLCSHGNLGAGWSCLGSGRPGCLDVAHHAAECSSGLEHRAGALPAFFFFSLPLFASGTQLPHLTFSIWPLPRGEIARVSKRGRHTS